MQRRTFLGWAAAVTPLRELLTEGNEGKALRLGLCTFSSHQHWKAAKAGVEGVKFSDAQGFYRHAKELGGDGVQAPVAGKDMAFALELRKLIDADDGYFEGDIVLPALNGDWEGFEREVKVAKEAGASLSRCYLTGARRYEAFKTPEEHEQFLVEGRRRLERVVPILERLRFKLAVENHKDQDAVSLVAMLTGIGSEWLGVTLDTGNNISLLEEPNDTIEKLAPLALTVHLKDMGVQPKEDGFLLSEVPFGTGVLDLPGVVRTLLRANPNIVLNVEMATRDPLNVPCLTKGYWKSHREQDQRAAEKMMEWVREHRFTGVAPKVEGVAVKQVLADEEANNRVCLEFRPKLIS